MTNYTKITSYTKTGDDGSTQTREDSIRVMKHDPRIHALGSLEEVNAHIGSVSAAAASLCDSELINRLRKIQGWLLQLSLQVTSNSEKTFDSEVAELEQWIDEWSERLPKVDNFILPAGSETVTRIYLARATTRRAERWVTAACDDWALPFLNRLGNVLLILARHLTWRSGRQDTTWSNDA